MYEKKGTGCKYSGNSVLAVNKPNTVNPRISGCYLSILISVERFTDITVSLYFSTTVYVAGCECECVPVSLILFILPVLFFEVCQYSVNVYFTPLTQSLIYFKQVISLNVTRNCA